MQSIKRLENTLEALSDQEHYLFSTSDFFALFPDLTYDSLKALLGRAAKAGVLERVCHGVYLYPRINYPRGLLLFHIAAKLRAGSLNYLSLETVLSDAGVISQIPMNWITLMSSGRTYTVRCDKIGTIEYIHTKKDPKDLYHRLVYDPSLGLWRANIDLALQDMRSTGRPMDLIDWSMVDESV